MSMEDSLSEALKYATLGGKGKLPIEGMIRTLMVSVEVNTLKRMQGELAKMQEHLDKRVLELSKQESASGIGEEMDPFTILGVKPDATEEEVEKAYKEKAWEVHPDRGGSNEKMALVNVAYQAIKQFMGWK